MHMGRSCLNYSLGSRPILAPHDHDQLLNQSIKEAAILDLNDQFFMETSQSFFYIHQGTDGLTVG